MQHFFLNLAFRILYWAEQHLRSKKIELLKNSIVAINKTASIAGLHKIETDGELIFQQF
ncbi:hypothetical protein G436_2955 [Leptospira interrogans serovar Hardjo str. Norma]|uniref:Uncharacterized protein n=1 Tax=Leptospira interrogans serovar Hardjo str. Norma TaxID=1279460 RepID=A0A0M4MV99_LEPIR|nr:hypothetical protein G436_2955 [Leptospira interrogans serovar Hardjo str. Norma]